MKLDFECGEHSNVEDALQQVEVALQAVGYEYTFVGTYPSCKVFLLDLPAHIVLDTARSFIERVPGIQKLLDNHTLAGIICSTCNRPPLILPG